METQIKQSIVQKAKVYMAEKGLSQAQLARICAISPSYISNIMNGIFDYKSSADKTTEINEKYFRLLAQGVEYPLEVSYWPHRNTDQYNKIINALCEAREKKSAKMIIGETGCGKTYAVDEFCSQYPVDTVRVTIMGDDHVNDITDEIAQQLDLDLPQRRNSRIRMICKKMAELALDGRKILLIIDEAENTRAAGIKAYKAIYDAVKGLCGFVLIGTPDLPRNIDKYGRYSENGIPQFKRRFKAGTITLRSIDHNFSLFLENITDIRLRETLVAMCSNYGELHDYLEPVIRASSEDGEPLTNEYFRIYYGIVKPKTI